MTYELSVRVQEGVLIATVSGVRNLENVVDVSQEVKDSCEKHGITKTLVDVRGFRGTLTTIDAFFLVTRHFRKLKDLRVIRQAAILDQKLSTKRHGFLENVAVNRGFNFKIFDQRDEAMVWLDMQPANNLIHETPTDTRDE